MVMMEALAPINQIPQAYNHGIHAFRDWSLSHMQRSITIEDLYKIKFLTRPCISPNGQRIALDVTTIDDQELEYSSSIWMVATDGSEACRYTVASCNTTSH